MPDDKFLTFEAMEEPSWEPALCLPLLPNASAALLRKARDQVIEYLQWVTNDGVIVQDPMLPGKIDRVAARLKEIMAVLPAIADAEDAAALDQQMAKEEAEYFKR
jgi:hypothetical protein